MYAGIERKDMKFIVEEKNVMIRPGARFSKVPRTFQARKAIRKNTTCLFCKADLFTCCKGNKSKNNGKVSCLETPSFWRYKENYVTRNTLEKFQDFRETGPWSLNLVLRSEVQSQCSWQHSCSKYISNNLFIVIIIFIIKFVIFYR